MGELKTKNKIISLNPIKDMFCALQKSENCETKSYIENVVYPYVNNAAKFTVVDVPANKSVICYAGTEVIVRSGSCTVIGSQNGGLSDVTSGEDIQNAELIKANHLLIVPRSDNRGVWTATKAILMIKGDYNIK